MATTEKFKKVKAENITPAATGKIDLHLQSDEKVEATIKKEVAKLNEGFEVALLDPSQHKKTAREKIAIIKKMVLGEDTESGMAGGLVINGIEDEEGYKKADKFRLMLVKLRTGVIKKHQSLKQNYLKVSKALDSEKNNLVGLLEEIETEVCNRLKVIDDQFKEKEESEKRARQEKLDFRIAEVKANGMQVIEGFYSIGQISVDIVTLEALTDVQYSSLITRVKSQNEILQKQAKKSEQRKRVESYLFEREKRKQAEQQRKMDEEAAEQKKERTRNRLDALEMIGFTQPNARKYYNYSNKAGNVVITIEEVETMSSDEWRKKMFSLNGEVNHLKESERQQEETEKKNLRYFERHKKLTSLGFVFSATEKEYFLSTELGKTNVVKESALFSDNLEFEKWFIEELQPAFEITLNEAKKIREAKQEKDNRTKQRVWELINTFGFVYGVGEFFVKSKFEKEPELEGLGLYIEEKQVIEMDGEEWNNKINDFTKAYWSLKQAEQIADERLKKDAEERRQSLLSEYDRVKEYFETVKSVKHPDGLKDAGLIGILEQFNVYLKHYDGLLQNLIQ